MKKFELIPASRATRNGTNKTSSSGDENAKNQIKSARMRSTRTLLLDTLLLDTLLLDTLVARAPIW